MEQVSHALAESARLFATTSDGSLLPAPKPLNTGNQYWETVSVSSLGAVTSEPYVFSETEQRQVDHLTKYLASLAADSDHGFDEESWQQIAEMLKSMDLLGLQNMKSKVAVIEQAVANAQEEQRRVQLFAVGKLLALAVIRHTPMPLRLSRFVFKLMLQD